MFKKYEHSYTIDTVVQLMSRCRKMYNAIDMMQTVFKLLNKLKTMQEKAGLEIGTMSPSSMSPQKKREQQLKDRIRGTIKSFLAQHTLFPIQFKFDGVDQLSYLKASKPEDSLSDQRIVDLRSPKGFGQKSKKRKAKSKSRAKSKESMGGLTRRTSMGKTSESKS